jgi:NAD(P)-dependent dehydrogenase (short-subunit alcohol dehydrogenase family)
MKNLKGKTAVVTGGNSGIGYATAQELIDQGANVLITGRKHDQVMEAAKKLNAIGVTSDQSDLSQISKLVKKTSEEVGRVDILFINAGTFALVPFDQVTEEFYGDFLDSNLKGVFFTLQKFLPILNDNASVILMSAGGTKASGAVGSSVYYITKAAINSMVRSLAIELAPRGIRINAVLPAAIDTPIFSKFGLPEEALPDLMNSLKEAIPLKKIGSASDVASLVAFLASDGASFITASEYVIDGGLAVKPIF